MKRCVQTWTLHAVRPVCAGIFVCASIAVAQDARAADFVAGLKTEPPFHFKITASASDRGLNWGDLGDDPSAQPDALLMTAVEEVERSIRFAWTDIRFDAGTLAFEGAFSSLRTADSLSFDRLYPGTGDSRVETTGGYTGVKGDLFAGRVSFFSAVGWSDGLSVWNPADEASDAEIDPTKGAARWHRFDLKLVDTSDVKLTVNGDFGSVDAGYLARGGARPGQTLAIVGERSYWRGALRAFGADLSVAYSDLANSLVARTTKRATVAGFGIDLSVYDKDATHFAFGREVRRTLSKTVVAEITPIDVLAEAGLADMGWAEPLVPTLASVEFERGEVTTPATPQGRAARKADLSIELMWDTVLGETSVSYWASDTSAPWDLATPMMSDRFAELSHTIKRGNWRFGFGISQYAHEETGAFPLSDASISGQMSASYNLANSVAFGLRLGRRQDEFVFDDEEDLRSTTGAIDLSIKLDASPFVSRKLGRDAVTKFEYRREVENRRETGAADASDNKEALLLTLGMPL